ncbi:glycoside hydrolase family 26 protein [Calocera cornea HHB12733]|uniref:Glycoside hydrolase family 26 protein n=1 Tax=Calocera cornea HHB12733 TaxID=1353952 RepID=A0A165HCC7_9BASI|nr:glycoside hydrolase family 26 protein [Calocera cornea HHB12733]
MQRNGIYFGMLPDWNFYGPQEVTRVFGTPVSIIGDYIYVTKADSSLSQIYYHTPVLKQFAANTVYAPAIIPGDGVGSANFTQDMANALANSFLTLNNAGITVWCRFAYEFNGYWNIYGQQPSSFKESWKMLYSAVKQAGAAQTYFLWSPNVWTGDINDPLNGYTTYYPGDDMVDLCGLSFYFFGDSSQTENILPSSDTFSGALQSFYDEYHTGHNKPIVISESSSPYHYDQPAGFVSSGNDTEIALKYQNASGLTPAGGGAGQLQIKQSWLEELTGATTATLFPGLVAVSWFNLFKDRNNQLMDFRAIYGDNATETYFRTTLGTSSGQPSGGLPSSATRLCSHIVLWALAIVPVLYMRLNV